MNLADKAARGGGVTLAFQAVKFIVQTASLILLARLLTPEDFGIVAMVVAITGAADLIRDFGLSLAAVQAKQLSDAERTNLFWANTGIGSYLSSFAVAGVFIVSGAATQFRAELMRSLRFTALSTTDVLAMPSESAQQWCLRFGRRILGDCRAVDHGCCCHAVSQCRDLSVAPGASTPRRIDQTDNPVIYGRYLARAQLIGGYFTASVLAVSAGVAEPLITVAFGEQWPAVAPIFALLAIGGVFRSVAQICYWVYLSHGLTGAQLRLYLFLRPAVIVITLAGLPWGAVEVAAASSIGFLVDWLVTLWHVHRVAGVDSMMLLRNSLRAIPPVRRTGRTARICRISPVCRTIRVLGSRHILRPGRSYPLRNALSHCPKRFDHHARLREKSRWPSSSSSEGTCRPKFTARLWRTRRPQARVHRFGEHYDAVELPDYRQEPMAHFHDGIGDDTGCRLFHDSLDATHLHRQI
ncbi:unnamed protein product, partial [Mesorhabditis spiculigera]